MDIAKRNEEADISIKEAYLKISKLRKSISEREAEINLEANKDYDSNINKWNKLQQELLTYKSEIREYEQKINDAQKDAKRFESQRQSLLAEYKQIIQIIKEIENRTVEFTEDDFRCPSCGRIFEEEDIATKQIELNQKFNERKIKDLELQNLYRESNISKGSALRKQIDTVQSSIAEYIRKKMELENVIKNLETNPLFLCQPQKIDITPIIQNDSIIKSINDEIVELQKEIHRSTEKTNDTTLLISNRKRLVFEIDSLKSAINNEAILAKDNARIKELESSYTEQSTELQRLSKIEYTMDEFSKERNRKIEERIDGMFKIVKFRWIKEQVNGIEKETCEASINGVPYASLNSAGKITAGLDIINAICKHIDICAPIVIDNAESINEFPETYGQKILLIVSNDESLKITNS